MQHDKAIKSTTRPELNYPEIVLGIVSPIGTDLLPAVSSITSQFEALGYDVYHIKLSALFNVIADLIGYKKLLSTSRYEKVNTYIDFGNFLRETYGKGILGSFSVMKIAEKRIEKSEQTPQRRKTDIRGTLYIIDQLKTEAELDLLREVYGPLFFQISVYSARDIRVDNLSKIMAHDDKKADRNAYREKAEQLVMRDEDEQDKPFGQKVGKIFQSADVVLNAGKNDATANIDRQIDRFVQLLFGYNGYSPTRMEYGMFVAYSAALRSLDLSRQVGAAIFRESGEIATLGANEVPKALGGTYWCNEVYDDREYVRGSDSNDKRKDELLHEVLEIALGKNFKLIPEMQKSLDNSQFMDALEYGRIVHAEMCAVTDAARLGIGIAGGTIYCTTFPCHMCSKHIVASGLAHVVFLEPYPKSLTADMHSDSVKIEGTTRGIYESFPSVNFAPFFGITPRRYRELFSRKKRKDRGDFDRYRDGYPRPIVSFMAPWYMPREIEIIDRTVTLLREAAELDTPKPVVPAAEIVKQ
ncbi:anti-phage dCTP deaminase [Candidatus Phyllobacterium onerii]|uniref:anti-phage dCTP deaminase n=1 Tax=Candidatus Phyllobacterium onerii TaxID=3020828 RepID=UPI002330A75B|nr:anti-phage dCTP deaminase [Phyllobacterium sp. IY22]